MYVVCYDYIRSVWNIFNREINPEEAHKFRYLCCCNEIRSSENNLKNVQLKALFPKTKYNIFGAPFQSNNKSNTTMGMI